MAHGTSQEGFDAEWRVIVISDGRRRPDQPLRAIRRGRPRRRAREVRRAQSAGAAAGKRGKPSGRALLAQLRGPRLGRHGRDTGRRHFERRSSSGRGRRRPTRSRCRNREHAGDRRRRDRRTSRRTVIATRGGRLALSRVRFSGRDQRPRRSTRRYSASSRSTPTTGSRRRVVFDLDDIDAAFEELDARYLAGEAAAHSHTWSVIARSYAAFNRHELPSTAPDWVTHRPPPRGVIRAR